MRSAAGSRGHLSTLPPRLPAILQLRPPKSPEAKAPAGQPSPGIMCAPGIRTWEVHLELRRQPGRPPPPLPSVPPTRSSSPAAACSQLSSHGPQPRPDSPAPPTGYARQAFPADSRGLGRHRLGQQRFEQSIDLPSPLKGSRRFGEAEPGLVGPDSPPPVFHNLAEAGGREGGQVAVLEHSVTKEAASWQETRAKTPLGQQECAEVPGRNAVCCRMQEIPKPREHRSPGPYHLELNAPHLIKSKRLIDQHGPTV